MGKFDKFGNNDATFAEIKEKTAENAMTFRMVDVKHLLRSIYNKEDVSYTEDIEKSIDEIGFADPIDVMFIDRAAAGTSKLKCLEGAGSEHRYMILSGHRRFEAALKKGIKEIPCAQINKAFANDAEIENFVLMANCQRNNMRDPLLYYKRYIMHRDYFTGNFPDMKMADVDKAIALRMGTTDRNVRRFRAIDGYVINPLLDMVRNEEIALSALDRVTTLTNKQQSDIYNLFQSFLNERVENNEDREISRSEANRIIKDYKEGGEKIPDDINISSENNHPEQLQKVTELETVSKNSDGQIASEKDVHEYVSGKTDEYNTDRSYEAKTDNAEKQNNVIGSLGHISESTHGSYKSLLWLLDKLTDTRGSLGCDWDGLKSDDEAADTAQIIANAIIDLIDEIYVLAKLYQIEDKRAEVLSAIAKAAGKQGKLSHPDGCDNMPCRSAQSVPQPA